MSSLKRWYSDEDIQKHIDENSDLVNAPCTESAAGGAISRIAGEINKASIREDRLLAHYTAVQVVAMSSFNKPLKLQGMSYSSRLMTIALAASGEGKNAQKKALSAVAKVLKVRAEPKIRSDKMIRKSIVDNTNTIFLEDEAEAFFNLAAGKNGESWATSILPTLNQLITDEEFYFNDDEKRIEVEKLEKQIKAHEKEKDALEKEGNQAFADAKESEINKLKSKRDEFTEKGGNPSMKFYCSTFMLSQPFAFKAYLNERSLHSGSLGRSLICNTGDTVSNVKPSCEQRLLKPLDIDAITFEAAAISASQQTELEIEEAASELLYDLVDFYDETSRKTCPVLKSVRARAAHLVKQLAVTLGAATGKVTFNDVLFALAIVENSHKAIKDYHDDQNRSEAEATEHYIKGRILNIVRTKCSSLTPSVIKRDYFQKIQLHGISKNIQESKARNSKIKDIAKAAGKKADDLIPDCFDMALTALIEDNLLTYHVEPCGKATKKLAIAQEVVL